MGYGCYHAAMPIYEYEAKDSKQSCEHCIDGFEIMRKMADEPLTECPQCGSPIRKLISAHAVGGSQSGLDDRAKSAGFHKLEKLGKGEYEKKY